MWKRFHGSELRVRRKRVRSICGGVWGEVESIGQREGLNRRGSQKAETKTPGPRGKGEGPQFAAATRRAVL